MDKMIVRCVFVFLSDLAGRGAQARHHRLIGSHNGTEAKFSLLEASRIEAIEAKEDSFCNCPPVFLLRRNLLAEVIECLSLLRAALCSLAV